MNGSSTLPAGTAMRTALIDAALRILHRDGAAALTVRSITAEAGCSTTGVYTYFGGKLGLVEAIYVEGFESFDRALDPLLERGDIAGSGLAYRHWALEHPTQYMVMFGRAVPEFEPSDEARSRGLVSFAKLAEAIARVRPGDDAPERAYHLFATVHGYVMLELARMAGEHAGDAERLYARAVAALVDAVA